MVLRTTSRWAIAATVCAVVALLAALGFGWLGWTLAWVGTVFTALSGGALGYLVSRTIQRLDLSVLNQEDRATAGLSQAILVGSFALALATGA